MLPVKNRLTKSADFASNYKNGLYIGMAGIAIKYSRSSQQETRIGFSVGKNFSKKATERNRARRILREAARRHIDLLKPGFDIVVMIQGKNGSVSLDHAAHVLGKLFEKGNLLT